MIDVQTVVNDAIAGKLAMRWQELKERQAWYIGLGADYYNCAKTNAIRADECCMLAVKFDVVPAFNALQVVAYRSLAEEARHTLENLPAEYRAV